MSKTKPAPRVEEMRAEYWLNNSQAKPLRFASKLAATSVVVLRPDVAAVFQSSDAVDDFLRSAIAATTKPRTTAKRLKLDSVKASFTAMPTSLFAGMLFVGG